MMTQPSWKRILKRIILSLLTLVILLYVAACGFLYVKQRDLLYFARTGQITPHVEGVAIQDLRIKNSDGTLLQAWYLPPAKPDGLVFLYLHGQGAFLDHSNPRYKAMSEHGAGFIAVAYRGFSGSAGTPTEAGIESDALTAYDYLIAQGYQPAQIVIHGHSLGSGVATYVAIKRSARALILESPFTAAVDVAADRYPIMPVNFLMEDKFLNRERVKAISMPILIAHGEQDTVIPAQYGERLFALAHSPKTLILMHGSTHASLPEDNIYAAYWRFLAHTLPLTGLHDGEQILKIEAGREFPL